MSVRVFIRQRVDPRDDCEITDDCESVYDIGLSDSGRTLSILEKAKANAIQKADEVKAKIDSMAVSEECVCDYCHKIFFRDSSDMHPVCPHCHHKYALTSELEQVDIFAVQQILDESKNDPVVKPVVEKNIVKGDIIKEDIVVDKTIDTQESIPLEEQDPMSYELVGELDLKDKNWQDSRKEQISLEMGSPEYKEYLEDLANNDPGRPDDARHLALEEYNQDLTTKDYDPDFVDNPESDEIDKTDDLEDVLVQRKMAKQAMHVGALVAVIDQTKTTASENDDRVARKLPRDNLVMQDPSVSADKYASGLKHYVMESSF